MISREAHGAWILAALALGGCELNVGSDVDVDGAFDWDGDVGRFDARRPDAASLGDTGARFDAGPDAGAVTCTPWVEDNVCSAGQWCRPDLETGDTGTCGDASGDAAGATCSGGDCGSGLFCSGAGMCTRLCDLDAAPGEPGDTCDTGFACFQLTRMGMGLGVGGCFPACDFDAGEPCSDDSLTCVPAAILEAPEDRCVDVAQPPLAEGDDCAAEDLSRGDLCAANAQCIRESGELRCRDLCRTSQGDFGTTDHPDCRDGTATCMDAFGVPDVGLCL